jgi:hypothetical protein
LIHIDATGAGISSNNIVENNVVYNAYDKEIFLNTSGASDANAMVGNIVRNNSCYWLDTFDAATYSTPRGIVLYGEVGSILQNTQISNNVVRNKPGIGIKIDAYNSGAVLYHNTVFKTHPSSLTTGGYNFYITNTGVSGIVLKNNIGGDSKNAGLFVVDKTLVTADNNLWFTSTGTVYANINGSNYHSDDFTAYKTATGWDAHGLWQDPVFVSTVTPDLHLQVTSPCIAAGDPAVGVLTDYDSVVRGAAVDIGAYEYV